MAGGVWFVDCVACCIGRNDINSVALFSTFRSFQRSVAVDNGGDELHEIVSAFSACLRRLQNLASWTHCLQRLQVM